jgi:peptidoglycan/LPS O-acetylase OafA/YrhL
VSGGGDAGRFPSLDGLRAFAVACVLLSHAHGTEASPLRAIPGRLTDAVGYVGVRTFFVVSGFLITALLLREHARTGTVSLRDFYLRRTLRIFPAAYALVAVVGGLAALGLVQLREGDLLHALTFTMNYHYERSWTLGHLWSLSVQEQFYVVWPLLLLLVRPRLIGHVAVAMILLAPLMRVAAWFLAPSRDDVIFEAYPCVMDVMATGSLLAILRPRLEAWPAYARFQRSPAFLLVPVALLGVVLAGGRVALQYTVDMTLQNVLIALVVHRCVSVRDGLVHGLLNARPVVYVGTISYSIYLWQEPFLNPKVRASFTAWPVNLLLALLCAIVSWHLVEKPGMALRERLRRRARAAAAPALSP